MPFGAMWNLLDGLRITQVKGKDGGVWLMRTQGVPVSMPHPISAIEKLHIHACRSRPPLQTALGCAKTLCCPELPAVTGGLPVARALNCFCFHCTLLHCTRSIEVLICFCLPSLLYPQLRSATVTNHRHPRYSYDLYFFCYRCQARCFRTVILG